MNLGPKFLLGPLNTFNMQGWSIPRQLEQLHFPANTYACSRTRSHTHTHIHASIPQIDPLDDLSTELERSLGKLVKQKYGTDFYIIHRSD